MRLILSLLTILLLVSCSHQQNPQENLTITGNIHGLKKGTIYLQRIQDTVIVTIDSIIVKGDANFEFATQLDGPEMLFLYLDKKDGSAFNDRLFFFAEPGVMTINTMLDSFEKDAVITGSENQIKYNEFSSMRSQFDRKSLEMAQENLKLDPEKDQDKIAALDKEYESLLRRRYLYMINYAVTHGDFEVAPYIALTEVFDANPVYIDSIYSSLSEKVKKSTYGVQLDEYIKEQKKIAAGGTNGD